MSGRSGRLVAAGVLAAGTLAAGAAVAATPTSYGIVVDPHPPPAGHPVTFTAQGVTCAEPVTCSWSGAVTGTGQSQTTTFPAPGTQSVTLTVDDTSDAEPAGAPVTVDVAVGSGQTPAVTGLTSNPATPQANQAVTFTAAATDADGDPLTYEWSVDGGAFASTGSATQLQRTFGAGNHSVAVRASDATTTSPERLLAFRVNRAPRVALTHSPATARVGQDVVFTAAAADPDAQPGDPPPSVAWRVGTTGPFRPEPTGSTLTRSFTAAGDHAVFVRATDKDGATVVASDRVSVTPQLATINSSSATPLTLEDVTFTPSLSDAKPGATFRWTINAEAAGTQSVLTAAFPVAGAYEVGLTVTNPDRTFVTTAIGVNARNRPPTVDFSSDPLVVEKGRQVTFTSHAADPEKEPMRALEWDLNGDGAYDDATGETASRTFATARKQTVGLRATDARGDEAVLRLDVVPGNRPPRAALAVSPSAPVAGVDVTLRSTSTDDDGTIDSTSWDLNGDGAYDDATGQVVTRRFATAGIHRVGLRVTDDDGSTDVRALDVDVRGRRAAITPSRRTVRRGPLRVMSPLPRVRIAGHLTPRGAVIELVSVTAPRSSHVRFSCRNGCPRGRFAVTSRRMRLRELRGFYRAGAVLEFRITRPGFVGKYSRIRILRNKAPVREDLCLWPGRPRARACPLSR